MITDLRSIVHIAIIRADDSQKLVDVLSALAETYKSIPELRFPLIRARFHTQEEIVNEITTLKKALRTSGIRREDLEREIEVWNSLKADPMNVPGKEEMTAGALKLEGAVRLFISFSQSKASALSTEMEEAIEALIPRLVRYPEHIRARYISEIKEQFKSNTTLELDDSGIYKKGFIAWVRERFGTKAFIEGRDLERALRTMLYDARDRVVQEL